MLCVFEKFDWGLGCTPRRERGARGGGAAFEEAHPADAATSSRLTQNGSFVRCIGGI